MSSRPSSSHSAGPSRPSTDLATLRRIKQTIERGEHPEYTAIIKPQALKQVTVSQQEAIEQNRQALAVKPRIIHKSRPRQPTTTTAPTKLASPEPPAIDLFPVPEFQQHDSVTPLDIASVSTVSVEGPTSSIRPQTPTPPPEVRSTNDASPVRAGLVVRLPVLEAQPDSSSSFDSDAPSPAADTGSAERTASSPSPGPDTQQPVESADPTSDPKDQPTSYASIEVEGLSPVEPPTPELPSSAAVTLVEAPVESSTSEPSFVTPLAQPLTVVSVSGVPDRHAPDANVSAYSTSDAQPALSSAEPNEAVPSAADPAASAEPDAMDVDPSASAEETEAKKRAEEREQEEVERERLRQERRAREKEVEKARYVAREKEKEAYRAKLREERERETQIEVQKYREEQRERERIAKERRAGPARARGHDQYGRPDPYAQQPSLPPVAWDARPAIDARFPPRAQPFPTDPHYIAPSVHRPNFAPVYERPVDGRPSSFVADPRDYPPDPYYNRLAGPPVRQRSPGPPPPQMPYPPLGGPPRGRSPSPPRRAFDRRSVSPPRRERPYDAGPPQPQPPPIAARPTYRDDRVGWNDDRERGGPGYRGGGPPPPVPTYAAYDRPGAQRPRSPPPSIHAYRRGPSPPLAPPPEDAAEIYRRMEALKEEMARLEKEAAVKRLIHRPPPPPSGGPPSYGRDGYGDRDGGRVGGPSYRDVPPQDHRRPYSPPPPHPPPQPAYRSSQPPPPPSSHQDSYSYRNRGPPPPLPPPSAAPRYAPRFDGPPPPRRDAPGPGPGPSSAPDPRDRERGYAQPPPQGRRPDERETGWRR